MDFDMKKFQIISIFTRGNCKLNFLFGDLYPQFWNQMLEHMEYEYKLMVMIL